MNNTGANNTTEVTTPCVFDLKIDSENDLCLIAPQKYFYNDRVTVSSNEFFRRLNKKLGEFFALGFNWSNIIMAGGLISGLLETQMDPIEYSLSDVDMFVYGENKDVIANKIQEIYDYFIDKLDKQCYVFSYTPNTPIINIIVPGECSFQIIGTSFKNEMEVLNSFDLTHCQVGFNGSKLVYTNEFVQATITRTTKITKRKIHAYRLVKTYNRGYSIARPSYCYITNIFHKYTSVPPDNIPSNTDKHYDINKLQQLIGELSENPIVIENLTKNFIPRVNINSKKENDEIMNKIGKLYAGADQYKFLNDRGFDLYVKDIKPFLIFTRMPFLC